jgi:TetR/AcrR family transcriptional repressor of nem operon
MRYAHGVARPKAFDPEHAVDAAMQRFWACGYDGTSIEDLTAACGIGRGSLYATFGSKDELYGRALERYQEREGARAQDCLRGPGAPLDRLRGLFELFASDALGDPANRGCFVLNAAMERGPHDPATARRVRDGLAGMERGLRDLLLEAQAAGDVPAGHDAEELARYLVVALNGIRVTAKATRDPATVRAGVDVALRALG